MTDGNGLPRGWATTTLGEITQPTRPRRKPSELQDLPFIGMEHVEAHTMRLLGTVSSKAMKSSAVHFQPGDVLYGRLRPYLNKVYRPDFEGMCSAEFIVLPGDGHVAPKFLQYLMNSSSFVSFASHLNEGDRPRVDFEQLSAYPIKLAPLPEQHRIVAEIETQFTRLDAAVAALKRAQVNLKRYRASVLAAACSGRLVPTEAELARVEGRKYEPADQLLARILEDRRARWEADQLATMQTKGRVPKDDRWKTRYPEPSGAKSASMSNLPEGWIAATVDQIAVVIRGASPRPAGDPRYFGGHIPWITVGALTADEHPYLTQVKETVTEAGRQASRYVKAGTLLLTNSGATLGVPKITLIDGCINDGSVALLYLENPLQLYLFYFLRTQTLALRAINQGAAQSNLNTTLVKNIVVPLPPLSEQQRIVAEIERRLSVVEEMETAVEHGLKRAERLRQAILKRAFEGKLVPQDPSDEPASVLLERIRAERAAIRTNETKRTGRRRATSPTTMPMFDHGDR